jgi:peptidoglycan/LPS O-acetylase OafA/YrhL
VVIYHAFPKWAHGGFIGVDIFFVISGFLITSIILKGLKENTFSFIWFYCKRIIRIFPALLLILATSIVLGWMLLYTSELQLLGKHLLAAVGFYSNFTYLGEAGYFDHRAVEKPLLHLWSLAIEEQFYVIWPFVLWFAYKCKARLGLVMLVLWILSFAVNIYLIKHNPVWDFYSPQSRFWELLSGALLANFVLNRDSFPRLGAQSNFILIQVISLLGLVALVVGVTITYAHSRFPGWLALLPVMGAVMLIGAGPQAWINRFFLASRPMVAIGLISYPLYLWHWILLSFAQIWGPIFTVQRLVLVALSVVLSWLTYLLVEKSLRNNVRVQKKALLLIVGMAAILLVAITLNRNGFEQRPINHLSQFELSGLDGGEGGFQEQGCGLSDLSLTNFFASCLQDKREPAKFALIGDSHATSLWPGLIRTSEPQNRWLTINGPGGPQNMRPYLSNTRQNVSAKDSLYTDKAVEQLIENRNIEVVLLTFSSNSLLPSMADASENDQVEAYKGLDSIASKLIQNNKKVVILVDNPHITQPQDCFHRKVGLSIMDNFNEIEPACEMPIAQYLSFTAKYRAVLNKLALAHPNAVYVFDATSYLCSADQGVCSYQKNGRRMYSYGAHVSDYAAGRVGEPLNQYLIKISGKK